MGWACGCVARAPRQPGVRVASDCGALARARQVFPASSRAGFVSRIAGRLRESLFTDLPAAVLDVDLCLRLMLSASFQLFVSTSQMQN